MKSLQSMNRISKLIFDDIVRVTYPDCLDSDPDCEEIAFLSNEKYDYLFSKSTPDQQACMNVWLLNQKITDETVAARTKEIYKLLPRIVPGFSGIDIAMKKVNGMTVGAMQYRSFDIARDLYNLMALNEVDGNLMLMHCTCTYDEFSTWQSEFVQTIESIQVCRDNRVPLLSEL